MGVCRICGRASVKPTDKLKWSISFYEEYANQWSDAFNFLCPSHAYQAGAEFQYENKNYMLEGIKLSYDFVENSIPDGVAEHLYEQLYYELPTDIYISKWITKYLTRLAKHKKDGFPLVDCEVEFCANLAKKKRDNHYVCGYHALPKIKVRFYDSPPEIGIGEVLLNQWLEEAKLNKGVTYYE